MLLQGQGSFSIPSVYGGGGGGGGEGGMDISCTTKLNSSDSTRTMLHGLTEDLGTSKRHVSGNNSIKD